MLEIRGYIQFNVGERSDYGWDVESASGSYGVLAMIIMVVPAMVVTTRQ